MKIKYTKRIYNNETFYYFKLTKKSTTIFNYQTEKLTRNYSNKFLRYDKTTIQFVKDTINGTGTTKDRTTPSKTNWTANPMTRPIAASPSRACIQLAPAALIPFPAATGKRTIVKPTVRLILIRTGMAWLPKNGAKPVQWQETTP